MPVINPAGGGGGAGASTQLFDSTLGGAAASFDITPISQSFNHLQIVYYLRGDTAATTTNTLLRFNNDSAANYDWQRGLANAAAMTVSESLGATSIYVGDAVAATGTAGYFAAGSILIPQYAGTTGNKSAVALAFFGFSNLTAAQNAIMVSGKWRTVGTAITRLTLLPAAGNFVAGSRVTLYGLT